MADHFIVTADGNELDIDVPRAGHITISAIAAALAKICRFNGHCARPYSVAEHSLLVREIAREMGLDCHGQLAALMHDAHEAFSGDLPTPLKAQVGFGWTEFEAGWERVVRAAFSLRTAFAAHGAAIKRADLIALATERRDLMPATPTPWACLDGVEPHTMSLRSLPRMTQPWTYWRDQFIDAYHTLEHERMQRARAIGKGCEQ